VKDITVDLLKSDDTKTLMARGEHSKEKIISAAIESGEIDESEAETFMAGHYDFGWFKAVPRDGYSTWYYPSREGVRGAFQASTIGIYW
jgi:hypothetical protein